MPTWLLPAAAGLLIVLFVGGGLYELHSISVEEGKLSCQATQSAAQVKQDTTQRDTYAKIDRDTPRSSDKRTAIKWLSGFTTNNGY